MAAHHWLVSGGGAQVELTSLSKSFFLLSAVLERGREIQNGKWEKFTEGTARKATAHPCSQLFNQQPRSKQGFWFFNCTVPVCTATAVCANSSAHLTG